MSPMSMLKTSRMLLFIVAFFTFILVSYELNYSHTSAQLNHSTTKFVSHHLANIERTK
jgi:hypothetical protein